MQNNQLPTRTRVDWRITFGYLLGPSSSKLLMNDDDDNDEEVKLSLVGAGSALWREDPKCQSKPGGILFIFK